MPIVPQHSSARAGHDTGHLPALDGLRAVSVAAVLAYHLDRSRGGFGGVDVFFVVSGFLITRQLLAEHDRTGRIDLGAFWARRVRRLLPAALLVIAAVALAAARVLPGWRMSSLRLDAVAALAYVANWRFIASGQSYFTEGAASPLRHLWSLAIEEQFYVLWPILVVVVARIGGRRLLALVATVLAALSAGWMALSAGGADLARSYYGSDARAFGLLAGAVLACGWPQLRAATEGNPGRAGRLGRLASWACLPLAALLALGVNDEASFYRWGFQALAVLSVVVVAGLATGRGVAARVLGSPPLAWLGRRSYGIYLWSWPVQVFLPEFVELPRGGLDLATVAITLALASASYALVEQPVRLGTGGWAGRTTSLGAGGAVAVVLVVVMMTTVGAPAQPSYLSVTDSQAAEAAMAPSALASSVSPRARAASSTTTPTNPHATPAAATAGPAGRLRTPDGPLDRWVPALVDAGTIPQPDPEGTPPVRVMLAGDSVGWSLGWNVAPELQRVALVSNRALLGCGIMAPDATYVVAGEVRRYNPACHAAEESERVGLAESPDVVVLWIGAWDVYDQRLDGRDLDVGSTAYARELEGRIQRRVDEYRRHGVPTVLPLVPCFGKGAPTYGSERQEPDRLEWLDDRLRAVAARNRTWVRLIDPGAVLCRDGVPVPGPDDSTLRHDGMHFADEQALWFWTNWLAPQLHAALAR
ncbi:MAG: hypothetical protein JWM47_9 [Acidimicrobiales bacterium]|nr:hypothetical protein [Acidimicrobiales bacterium]